MPEVAIADYKRVSSLLHKTISVEIPEDLVARKGHSRAARRKCQRAQERLKGMIHSELREAQRRAFRGYVAIHLELFGVSLDRRDEARRTVKAILDSLKGPVYPDDSRVALLDVSMDDPGADLAAEIAICSVGQYRDAFDVLAGVSSARDDDDLDLDDPWRWNRVDESRLELAEEHLADGEAEGDDSPWAELRSTMIEHNQGVILEARREAFLWQPYWPSDRPGAPNRSAQVWLDSDPVIPRPTWIYLPGAKRGADGSWTAIAENAIREHMGRFWPITTHFRNLPVAVDIAIGRRACGTFDVDNLAHRVLGALLDAVPDAPTPLAYRAYRWHGPPDAVLLRFHSVDRARQLRRLLSGSPLAACGLRPHPEGPVYRRRPLDAASLGGGHPFA